MEDITLNTFCLYNWISLLFAFYKGYKIYYWKKKTIDTWYFDIEWRSTTKKSYRAFNRLRRCLEKIPFSQRIGHVKSMCWQQIRVWSQNSSEHAKWSWNWIKCCRLASAMSLNNYVNESKPIFFSFIRWTFSTHETTHVHWFVVSRVISSSIKTLISLSRCCRVALVSHQYQLYAVI